MEWNITYHRFTFRVSVDQFVRCITRVVLKLKIIASTTNRPIARAARPLRAGPPCLRMAGGRSSRGDLPERDRNPFKFDCVRSLCGCFVAGSYPKRTPVFGSCRSLCALGSRGQRAARALSERPAVNVRRRQARPRNRKNNTGIGS